jgi:toxin ParE1/3/4
VKAILAPAAGGDLRTAWHWIRRDSRLAAAAFRTSVSEAADRIGTHRDIGVSRPDLTSEPVRFLFLTRFPYVLVYDPEPTPPVILRVLHASRDIEGVLRRP